MNEPVSHALKPCPGDHGFGGRVEQGILDRRGPAVQREGGFMVRLERTFSRGQVNRQDINNRVPVPDDPGTERRPMPDRCRQGSGTGRADFERRGVTGPRE